MSCFSTSFFSRLKTNGRRIVCKRSITRSFSSSVTATDYNIATQNNPSSVNDVGLVENHLNIGLNVCEIVLTAWSLSPAFSNGVENHFSKLSLELKTVGCKKFN